MTIEHYRPELLPAMVALWNAEMGADFPMTDRLFRQNVPDSPAFEPDDVLVVTEGDELLGLAVSRQGRQFERDLWFAEEDGWVNSIVVAREHQRNGIGTILLGRAESYLREHGARRVMLGSDLLHFFPGIPTQYEPVKALAEARGYQLGGIAHDMWRDLEGYETPERVRELLEREAPAIQIRAGTREDMPGMAKFLTDEFPGRWRWEGLQYLEAGGYPEEFMLLFDDGQIIGFSQTYCSGSVQLGSNVMWNPLLGEHFGGLGPIGIAESHRGRGLGLALLCESVADMKRRGVRRMCVDWTGLVDFYGTIGFTIWKSYQHAEKAL